MQSRPWEQAALALAVGAVGCESAASSTPSIASGAGDAGRAGRAAGTETPTDSGLVPPVGPDGGASAPDASSCDTARLATDARNCGACGHDCHGGACRAAMCQPLDLATGQVNARAVASDGTNVYWTTSDGPVLFAPRTGGVAKAFALGRSALTKGGQTLTVDARNVVFANQNGDVLACPLAGCSDPFAPTLLASDTGYLLSDIASDGTNVWWTAFDNVSGHVGTSPLAGGGAGKPFAPFEPQAFAIAVDSGNVYWTQKQGPVRACAVGISCPSPVTAAPTQNASAYDVAVGGSDVYWTTTENPGRVLHCPARGCPAEPGVLVTGRGPTMSIVSDGTSVYWVEGPIGSPAIMKCPVGRCPAPALWAEPARVGGLAVDAEDLYWTEGDRVRRVAK